MTGHIRMLLVLLVAAFALIMGAVAQEPERARVLRIMDENVWIERIHRRVVVHAEEAGARRERREEVRLLLRLARAQHREPCIRPHVDGAAVALPSATTLNCRDVS